MIDQLIFRSTSVIRLWLRGVTILLLSPVATTLPDLLCVRASLVQDPPPALE
jgi:hypothetical protein